MYLRFRNTLLAISKLADLESHLHQLDKETTRNIDEVVVNKENPNTETSHKDIDNNSDVQQK